MLIRNICPIICVEILRALSVALVLPQHNFVFSGGKLASLEEFKVQKDDLMAKFEALEEELAQELENHKEATYELEKKQVVDKDRYDSNQD